MRIPLMKRWRRGGHVSLLGVAVLAALCCTAVTGCAPSKESSGPPVFYPPLPQRPRIQFLRELTTSDDVVAQPSGFALFVLGEDKKRRVYRVNRPYGMALWDGKLYVCDSGARAGLIFDFKQREFRLFGVKGLHKFLMPVNVSVGPKGEKYVSDTKRGEVLVYGPDDKPVRTIAKSDGMKPCDAVWHDGELFVADLGSNSILVFDPESGRLLRQFGKSGKKPGEFAWPTNLAFGPDGYLYVSDTLNARVQKLDRQGKVANVFGGLGLALGKMIRPKGIAVDRAGRLYVADAAPQSVQIYDPGGPTLTGGPDLTFDATNRTITRDSGSWARDGFQAGQVIRVLGSSSNDGTYRLDAGNRAVTTRVLMLAAGAKLTDEGPSKVIAVAQEARLLLMLGGAGPDPGDMSLPAKVVISYEGIEHFERYAAPDFKIEHLIFVSNHFSAKKINVYGFGTYQGAVPAERDKGKAPAAPGKGDKKQPDPKKPRAPSPKGPEKGGPRPTKSGDAK